MRGSTIITLDRPPLPTYAPGRCCAHDGCITRLSVYNSSRFCFAHGMDDEYLNVRMRPCAKCGVPQPLNDEHYHHDRQRPDGWHRTCKRCRNSAANRLYVVNKERRRLSTPGSERVVCRQCGTEYRRTAEFWSFGAKGRLVQPCLDCQDANQKRRAAKTLDGYYRRKYGVTKAEREARTVEVVFPHRNQRVEVAR
jgi:hypothetical protein